MVCSGGEFAQRVAVKRPWVRLVALALLLTLLSFALPREPALGWEGNQCLGKPCAVAVRQAGWPVTMVRDNPDLSAIGSFFIGDHWSLAGFALNLVFYAGALLLLRAGWRAWKTR